MMNMQNPALYPPQQAYAYGAGMAQPSHMPSTLPNDLAQHQYQQQIPTTSHQPGQFPQPGNQIPPPHLYQQLQQQQGGFARPQSQGSGTVTGQRQSPGNGQFPNQPRNPSSQSNNIQTANMISTAQQSAKSPMTQGQNNGKSNMQTSQATPPSPQSISREKARVTILLEINSRLLQELVTLQSQGKAGTIQQSPTSPNSATENFNSPVDATKIGPTKEFTECIRRLQANLSYLAAVADAKKRSDGKVPPYPAILSPPAYLTSIHESYKKLSSVFPEASQSATNKAIAFASAQQNPMSNQNMGDGQL